MRRSVLILFCLNLAFVLFPVVSPDRDPTGVNSLFFDQITVFGRVMSSVLTPLLVAGALAFAALDRNSSRINSELVFFAGVVCVLMTISGTFGPGGRIETYFMALFFVLFTIYLSLMKGRMAGTDVVILRVFKSYFIIWLLAPLVAMAVDPSLFDMFFTLTAIDFSYHGLTNSRVGYGLWISVFILFLGRPRSTPDKILLAASVATLLLSQSRAAIVGLALAYAYAAYRGTRGGIFLLRLISLAMLAIVPLVLWSIFGRDDAFTIVSEERGVLYARFVGFVEQHWLLGNGSMYLVDIPEIDFYDVPAHNLLLQTVANYGVVTLVAYLAYLACMFRFLHSTRARMLLIFMFIYGMYQPVQGTGNFFNPITLLFFLITLSVETATTRTHAGPRLRKFDTLRTAHPTFRSQLEPT